MTHIKYFDSLIGVTFWRPLTRVSADTLNNLSQMMRLLLVSVGSDKKNRFKPTVDTRDQFTSDTNLIGDN